MITSKGLPPLKALVLTLVLVMTGLLIFMVFAALSIPLMTDEDGSKMAVYGNVITASDGNKYYVTVTDSFVPGKPDWRVADAYSLDSQYASITGVGRTVKPISWTKLSVCSQDEVRENAPCRHIPEAEALLNEMIQKVMARENVIGNMSLFWGWELGRRDFLKNPIAP